MIVIVNYPPVTCGPGTRSVVIPMSPATRFTARYLITNLPLKARLRIVSGAEQGEPVLCEYVRWYSETLGARFKVDVGPGNPLYVEIDNFHPLEFNGYVIGETAGKAPDPDDAPMVLPFAEHELPGLE